MFPQLRLSQSLVEYSDRRTSAAAKKFFNPFVDAPAPVLNGIRRRWARERRRRKVGRAYDMALEIARVIPPGSRVLDVGCGNGYIAHHLSAILGTSVIGIDVSDATEAPIDYRQFNGCDFPVEDDSVDAVVVAYVLHHAQDLHAVLAEIKRVLRPGGLAVIYEDIPETPWDRFICWTHDLQWRRRTGTCTFRHQSQWQRVFAAAGFEVIHGRQLSRMRNLMHPVCRRFFLLGVQPIPLASVGRNPPACEAAQFALALQ